MPQSSILLRMQKGLLPNTLGIINLKSQYNTMGIIGIYEALQRFGYTYKDEFGYTFYSEKGLDFRRNFVNMTNSR